MMRVRLTRKLAEALNGVDLSERSVGDVFDLSYRAAQILIDEGWAEIVERPEEPAGKTQRAE